MISDYRLTPWCLERVRPNARRESGRVETRTSLVSRVPQSQSAVASAQWAVARRW